MFPRVLVLLLWLPVSAWPSHIAFDGVPEPGLEVLAALPAVAAGCPDTYYDDVTTRIGGGARRTAATIGRVSAEADGDDGGPLAAGTGDAVPGGGLAGYAFYAYLVRSFDLYRGSGAGTSAAVTDFPADRPAAALSTGATRIVVRPIGRTARTGAPRRREDESGMEIMDPDAPASQWLRVRQGRGDGDTVEMDVLDWHRPMGEPVALCLIGVVAIMPSMLRRRDGIGRKRCSRRRKPYRGAIPPSSAYR